MIIKTVEKFKNIYLVNGKICVPLCKENKDYLEIQKWILEGGIVKENNEILL